MSFRPAIVSLLALESLLAFAPECAAQPERGGEWTKDLVRHGGFTGGAFIGSVRVFRQLDDGTGPALYAGGTFDSADGVAALNIARWDGERWAPMGSGLVGTVWALAAYDSGDGPRIHAGGDFGVRCWNGTQWCALPFGPNGRVETLEVFDDGTGPELFAGGRFTEVFQTGALNSARWNGRYWWILPGGVFDLAIHDFAVFDDGSGMALYAAGEDSSTLPSTPNTRIAKWTAAGWEVVARVRGTTKYPPGLVRDLVVYDDGSGTRLCAAGIMAEVEGQQLRNVACFDGQSWRELGNGGLDDDVFTLESFDDGNGPRLFAGGELRSPPAVFKSFVAAWDGIAWTSTGRRSEGGFNLFDLAAFDVGGARRLAAAGYFEYVGNGAHVASNVAAFDGVEWLPFRENGIGGSVVALGTLSEGPATEPKLVAAFGHPIWDDVPPSMGWWDGTRFRTFGSRLDGYVKVLETLDLGDGPTLFAGGRFSNAGGRPVRRVARWDGNDWQAVGDGLDGTVHTLAVFDDGDGKFLYAGGDFGYCGSQRCSGIARWNGASWVDVGTGLPGVVLSLCVYDAGGGPALFAGGAFPGFGSATQNVARYRDGAWQAVGRGLPDDVESLAVHDDGGGPMLYASGEFGTHNGPFARIARYGGVDWERVGFGLDGFANALVSFDDGTGNALYAGGNMREERYITRWDGSTWETLRGGADDHVYALQPLVDDDGPSLYVGGKFNVVDGLDSHSIARWRDPVNAVRLGTVGASAGTSEDVLFVNDSNTRSWRAPLATYVPVVISMTTPRGASTSAPFALYGRLGAPGADDVRELPYGIGKTFLPIPLVPDADPSSLRAIWNNTGRGRLGVPTLASTPAPSIVVSAPSGTRRPISFTLQGVIADPRSRSRVGASVTNCVVVETR